MSQQREGQGRFPYGPLTALAMAMLANSYSLTSLFPYVGYMVVDLNMTSDINKAGYYAGYIGASFMVGRFVSSYYWGQFSDIYGRKIVIYIGIASIAVFSLVFGFSVSFWMAVSSRLCLGLMNGLVGVAKTIVSEVCSKEHEAAGMGAILGTWSLGLIIGPAIGGLLARPAQEYPAWFGDVAFLQQFPYLLPNIIPAVLALIALPIVYLYLPETLRLPRPGQRADTEADDYTGVQLQQTPLVGSDIATAHKSPELTVHTTQFDMAEANASRPPSVSLMSRLQPAALRGYAPLEPSDEIGADASETLTVEIGQGADILNHSEGEPLTAHESTQGERSAPTLRQLLNQGLAMRCIALYAAYSIVAIMFDEMFPLWALTSLHKGGLQLHTSDIGKLFALNGLFLVLFQLSLYSRLANYFGAVRCFHVSFLASAPAFLIVPLVGHTFTSKPYVIAALVVATVYIRCSLAMGFAAVSILINNSVSDDMRGSLNGLSMTIGSLAKAMGPLSASLMYAWSLHNGLPAPLDYHFTFVVLALLQWGCAVGALVGIQIGSFPQLR